MSDTAWRDDDRIARLEKAMADMAEAMIETREDIRRLYMAWPHQFHQVTEAADHVRQRVGTAEVAIVNEIRRVHERLDTIVRMLMP